MKADYIRDKTRDITLPIKVVGATQWIDHSGVLHRLDGPARIWDSGSVEYLNHGERHRLDGPASIWSDGRVEYWVNGEVPSALGDMVFLDDHIDQDDFPSAEFITNYFNRGGGLAYRIHDSSELALAILRYG